LSINREATLKKKNTVVKGAATRKTNKKRKKRKKKEKKRKSRERKEGGEGSPAFSCVECGVKSALPPGSKRNRL
jgi:hypothetical protein